MKLSTKSRYAVTALFDLFFHQKKGPISAIDISRRQGISIDYLEQLLHVLRKKGLIKSVRGPGGGYLLSKNAKQIKIGDIIRATEGPVSLVDCLDNANVCKKTGCCSTRSLWKKFSKEIEKVLDKVTLDSLCNGDIK